MIFNDFGSIFNGFDRRDGAAGVSGNHPGVTRESRGVSGSFGERFGTRFGHVAQKKAEIKWGGGGLVRDLDCNYALGVFMVIFYHQ